MLPAHVGMRVRFTGKFNAANGLVQEQRAMVVDFVFHEDDARRYRERPRRLLQTKEIAHRSLVAG